MFEQTFKDIDDVLWEEAGCTTELDYTEQTSWMLFDFVLAQYVKEGVGELDSGMLPDLLELKYHTVNDAAAQLGGIAAVRDTFVGFQKLLYQESMD